MSAVELLQRLGLFPVVFTLPQPLQGKVEAAGSSQVLARASVECMAAAAALAAECGGEVRLLGPAHARLHHHNGQL